MLLGSENFFENFAQWGKGLSSAKIGVVANQSSVNAKLQPIVEQLWSHSEFNIHSILAPQHGYFGEKQDNMIEAHESLDSRTGIPVWSLYGENKLRPRKELIERLDVVLYDVQDVGVRIYTFITTLLYLMQLCHDLQKKLIVMDRPNPLGRQVDGSLLSKNFESFVGAAAIPLQYGLTVGELAKWYQKHFSLHDLELIVVPMQDYSCREDCWPKGSLHWVPPSPNLPTLEATRCYPGTVLLEGTLLSEGRGTALPLHQFGVPELKVFEVLEVMKAVDGKLCESIPMRVSYFEPTYHKFCGEKCVGLQWMTEDKDYCCDFRPYLLMACFFKALKQVQPELMAWRQPPYEYEYERLPIDLINGNEGLKHWVDGDDDISSLKAALAQDRKSWLQSVQDVLMYP